MRQLRKDPAVRKGFGNHYLSGKCNISDAGIERQDRQERRRAITASDALRRAIIRNHGHMFL